MFLLAQAADWLCDMSATIKANVHSGVLVTSGGGGIGTAVGTAAEFARAKTLARCAALDVLALHSYAPPSEIDRQLEGYSGAMAGTGKRLILQEWGVQGANSTQQAVAFRATAAMIVSSFLRAA